MKHLFNRKAVLGILALLAVLCACITASAASSGACGDNLTWTLDDEGVLAVSGTGNMDDYEQGVTPWGNSPTIVIIEKGVTGIGNNAFFGCHNLDSITIPNSVITIGEGAFANCFQLTSITIPDSVISIGDYAFLSCNNLNAINVDPHNTAYTSDDDILFNKEKNTLIVFPSKKEASSYIIPDSVNTIYLYAFENCKSLKDVTIPDSVTTIYMGAFSNCSGLTSITLPASISTIWYDAFVGCLGLKEFIVDSGNTRYASSNGVLFNKDMTELISYPVSKTDTSYSVPDSVTFVWTCAFSDCSNLISITLSNKITDIGPACFQCCRSLASITIPKSLSTIEWSTFLSCSSLESVTIPKTLSSISSGAFYGCDALKNVYYTGSMADREALSIDEGNDPLVSAEWHYSSPDPDPIDISGAKISSIKAQTYTGKAIKPAITVKLDGKNLAKDTDYKVSYKNNKAVGTATVTVTGKGNYTGTIKATFKINPKPVSLSSLTAGSKKLTVKWKKSSGITGYELQYSLKKNFSSKKTVNISKAKTTSKEIKSLKKGKTYYVRIRAYKTVNGTKYYSAWSKVLKAKVK